MWMVVLLNQRVPLTMAVKQSTVRLWCGTANLVGELVGLMNFGSYIRVGR